MVYKRYIKIGGKLYGPYVYKSYRKNGKVVSECLGKEKKKLNFKGVGEIGKKVSSFDFNQARRPFMIILGIFVLVILGYFAFQAFQQPFSGKAILNIEATYHEGEPLDGLIRLNLKQGELLPTSSQVIVETASGAEYTYNLNELITEATTEGNFYVEGKNIQGDGIGYGVSGTKTISPNVYFILSMESKSTSEESEEPAEEAPEEQPEENATEEPSEEISAEEEQPSEEVPEEPVEEIPEETTEEPAEEAPAEETTEEPAEEAPVESGGSPLTGQVSMEIENEVEGEVTSQTPFTYAISSGKTAKIKPGSVRTADKELSDSDVVLSISEDSLQVTTTYSESEEGFGSDYLGDVAKQININLADLDVPAEKGNLNIRLVYDAQEIVSISTTLDIEGETVTAEGEVLPELSGQNITANESVANITEVNATKRNITEIPTTANVLTEEERAVLNKAFGNISISTSKAEVFNNRLIVRYELGNYWIEYSYNYDSGTGVTQILERQMEIDRIRWLKDLARMLSEQEKEAEEVEIPVEYNI